MLGKWNAMGLNIVRNMNMQQAQSVLQLLKQGS